MTLYDAIIIGAGPAGLSAGIYLARFRRKTLLIDAEKGRSTLPGTYHNIMGFLDPIERRQLRKLGAQQAQIYGAEKICGQVEDIKIPEENNFNVITQDNSYLAKNIIFCNGVMDNWPEIEGYEQYLGCTLHSCPICAGYESIDKKIVVIGSNRVAGFALELLTYTDKITIVTNGENVEINSEQQRKLEKKDIPVMHNKVVELKGQNTQIEKVVLDNGDELDADIVYSARGVHVESELAQKIGIKVNESEYIIVDNYKETNIKGAFAAGDITNFDSKQVVTAMYEGFMAAHSIHKKLLKEEISKI